MFCIRQHPEPFEGQNQQTFEGIVLTVAHDEFLELDLPSLLNENGVFKGK